MINKIYVISLILVGILLTGCSNAIPNGNTEGKKIIVTHDQYIPSELTINNGKV